MNVCQELILFVSDPLGTTHATAGVAIVGVPGVLGQLLGTLTLRTDFILFIFQIFWQVKLRFQLFQGLFTVLFKSILFIRGEQQIKFLELELAILFKITLDIFLIDILKLPRRNLFLYPLC